MKTFDKSFIKKKLLGKASAKETFRKSFIKAQSAMEYLMTYGWAILIIAVVLGALFQLGVFNPNNFVSKAPPGSCQVLRPNGPYSPIATLGGTCNGELPQYAAKFNNPYGISPNVAQMYINISGGVFPAGPIQQITITGWEKGSNPGATIFTINGASINIYPNNITWFSSCSPTAVSFPTSVDTLNGNWHFIALSINVPANTMIGYIDSYNSSNSSAAVPALSQTSPPKAYIGVTLACANSGWFPWRGWNGELANVQVYSTSLSPSEIRALYSEGIGGAPVDLQNLVGWWPLNGNANDYSGNDNNGVPTANVIFVSNWWRGYTPP